MRVVFWCQSFWPYIGGVELFAMRLLPALRDRGHEIAVVTSHGSLELPDEDQFTGIAVHRLPFQDALAGGDARLVLKARQRTAAIKRSFQPDLVHLNLQDPSVFFHIHTTRAWPCPTLLTVHGELGDCDAGAGTLLGRALREADWVTAVSRALLDDVRALVPEVGARSSLLYNAVPDLAADPPGMPVDSRRILCVGRQVPEKGFDLAIAAFSRIHAAYPDARLVFASDGPERPRLEKQAEELGIAGAVNFLGWQSTRQLEELFTASSMILMPSRWREGFGLVALEAAIHARPVIAARVGGLPEVIVDGETGLLVDKEDSEALAAAALELLRDPAYAARLGAAARERATSRFDFNDQAAQYDDVYRRVAAPGHGESTGRANRSEARSPHYSARLRDASPGGAE